MTSLIESLKGRKTYLLAFALLAYAIGGYITGHLTLPDALGLIWGSGIVSSIRAAISKATPQ